MRRLLSSSPGGKMPIPRVRTRHRSLSLRRRLAIPLPDCWANNANDLCRAEFSGLGHDALVRSDRDWMAWDCRCLTVA